MRLKEIKYILFSKRTLLYYWVPRIIVSILIFAYWNNFQMEGEFKYSPPNPLFIPDQNSYLTSISGNPLFTLNFRFLRYLPFFNFFNLIISEFIVSFSCLLINYKCREFIKNEKLALFLLGAHPILAIYSLRFCSEIFGLLSISLFISYQISFLNASKKYALKANFYLKNLLVQLSLVFYRFQIFTISIFQFFDYIKKIKNNLSLKQKLILLIFTIVIFFLVIKLNSYYLNEFSTILDTHYPFGFLKINKKLCSLLECNSLIVNTFSYILAFLTYILIAIICLTGARGRFIDLPWRVEILNFNIINNQSIIKYDDSSLINFDSNKFILIAVVPLILFSLFHIIGYLGWVQSFKSKMWKIYLIPLSIVFLPIIYFPYLRYFIPLIPLSCIGFSNLININFLSTRKYNLFGNKI